MKHTHLFIALVAVTLTPFGALAKPDKHPKDKMHHEENVLGVAISIADRAIIRDYLRDNHRPNCPPGLAKKRNGCLPPGIAKKYAMGKPLPPGIAHKQLPNDLLSRLHPVAGYHYIQVDKDVLLISEATKKIVDAVTLLSAVQ